MLRLNTGTGASGIHVSRIRQQASQYLTGDVLGPQLRPHLHFTAVEDPMWDACGACERREDDAVA